MNSFEFLLRRTLQIRQNEQEKVWLISKHHFLQGLGIAFIHITAVKLFFKDFNPDSPHYTDLAIILIIAATVQLVAGRIYAYFEHNAAFEKLQKGVVASLIIISLAFTISLWLDPKNKYLIFGLLISYYLFYQISNLELWGVAALLFDVRQGKRLFTIISIGNIPAKILGYFSYLVLYKVLGKIEFFSYNKYQLMLLIGFLSFGGSYYILDRIIRKLPLQKIDHHVHDHLSPESGLMKIFKSPFTLSMAVLSFTAYLTFHPVEYKFLLDANNTTDIAAFIAVYYGLLHVISGVFQMLVSNRIIKRYGVLTSLLILPVLLLITSFMWLLIPQSLNIMNTTLTMSMLVMLIWVVIYYGLYNPLFLGMFQPLDVHSRLHGHTVVKGLINPMAMLVCGVLLYVLNVFAFNIVEDAIILLTIFSSILFIISVRKVNKQYSLSLQQGIKSKWFRGDRFVVMDKKHLHILDERLESEYPADIIYSLEVLKNLDKEKYKETLLKNLNSPHPDVQMYCIQNISNFPDAIDIKTIIEIAKTSKVDHIKKLAVELYCKIAEFDQEEISSFMDSSNPVIKKAALVGLIKRGDLESVVNAGQQLLTLMHSEKGSENIQALEILGDLGIKSYYRPVLEALKSTDQLVQKKGVEISAQIANSKLLPELLRILYEKPNSKLVRNALVKIGEPALESLEDTILKEPPVLVMKSIIRVCEKVDSRRSQGILVASLSYPNQFIQSEATSALSSNGFKADPQDHEYWEEQSEGLFDKISLYLSFIEIFTKRDYIDLVSSLKTEVESLKIRLMNQLCFIYEETTIQRAKSILLLDNPGSKANAIETLEQELPGKWKKLIPVLEDEEDEILIEFPITDPNEIVHYILNGGLASFNRWTIARAIQHSPDEKMNLIAPYLFTSSAILHDTAFERLKRLTNFDKNYFEDISDTLFTKIQNKLEGEKPKLLTIEKVIALKGTSLFSNIPENLLIDIAEVLQVEEVKKDEVLFKAGDTGNYMYIIYEGLVKIHSGSTVFATLKSRDFFGELALLDTQPRSATATAEEDCLLLRLNQEIFYELLTENKEFAKGFLKTLTERLRKQNIKLRELDG